MKIFTKTRTTIVSLIVVFIIILGSFFAWHKYTIAVNARDSILMGCMIRNATLQVLDSKKLSTEQKVAFLKQHLASSIEINLGALEMWGDGGETGSVLSFDIC